MVHTYVSLPVQAEQFHIGDLPEIIRSEDGRALCTVKMGKDKVHGILNELVIIQDDVETVVDPGDWIVRSGETFYVYTHEQFVREYTQVVA